MTIYPARRARRRGEGRADQTNISAVCQAALRAEPDREKAIEKTDADGYQRVVLYDGKREHDIASQGRKIGSGQKADAWLTPCPPGGNHPALPQPSVSAWACAKARRSA